jgi:serine/threonine protein kinase
LLFPACDPVGIDLLQRLLAFNPEKRLTLNEALRLEWFNPIREIGKETISMPQEFAWDDDSELTLPKMRECFMREIRACKQQLMRQNLQSSTI